MAITVNGHALWDKGMFMSYRPKGKLALHKRAIAQRMQWGPTQSQSPKAIRLDIVSIAYDESCAYARCIAQDLLECKGILMFPANVCLAYFAAGFEFCEWIQSWLSK